MGDVSRETIPAPHPEVAARVFPSGLSVLARYAGLLADEGVTRGLIGPREVPRLWDRHLVNCGLLTPLVPAAATVVDLGSGAGLPGVVLAIARPDLQVTLVEPMARRVAFLEEVRDELALANVTIVRERVEQWRDAPSFAVATARALAPLPRLLSWSLPLLTPGGELLAMKGMSAEAEIESSTAELRRWGASAEVVRSSVPGSSTTTVVRVVRDPAAEIGWTPTSAHSAGRRRRRRERG
jgi:16S rRNA (guanine527-N7)-methyltransferase